MSTTCALTTTIAELQDLLTWPDGWNSYDALAPNTDAVAHAATWITGVYRHLISSEQQWIAPNVTASADGEVVLEWRHGQRKLTIYVDEQDVDYLQVWSNGTKAKMTDGNVNSIDDAQNLLQWLTTNISTGAII